MRKNKYKIQQQVSVVSTDDKKNKDKVNMTFNIFQAYQYFTIYRCYFVLKFEYFHIYPTQQSLKSGGTKY